MDKEGEFYIALYDYEGDDGQLSFKKNDEIFIIRSEEATSDWLLGTINGSDPGWIPANYVQPIKEYMNTTSVLGLSKVEEREKLNSKGNIDEIQNVECNSNSQTTSSYEEGIGCERKDEEEIQKLETELNELQERYMKSLKINDELKNNIASLQTEKDQILSKLEMSEEEIHNRAMQRIYLILQQLHANVMQQTQNTINEARGNSWQEVQSRFFKEGWRPAVEISKVLGTSRVRNSGFQESLSKTAENVTAEQNTQDDINLQNDSVNHLEKTSPERDENASS